MIPLDYETLRLIWWALLGVLLIGFALMDGFDLGIGALLPFVAKSDAERRILINIVGPVWEGNQVWLILGGGAVFAAWPALYAVSFSGFYLAMIVILLALILRPVGFKFRGKIQDRRWRASWDWALFVGGAVPALIFGVAVGNVLSGVPFTLDDTLRPSYAGGFFGLLMPFPLVAGLVSLSMMIVHGAAVIAARTEGVVAARAREIGQMAAIATAGLFALGGLWMIFADGYVVTSIQDGLGASNPLGKTVEVRSGGWLANYAVHPWMVLAPLAGFAGAALAWHGLRQWHRKTALLGSSLAIIGIIATAGLSLFPFLLPSSINPEASLTVWDASSSQLTLWTMLLGTLVFMPLIIAYTTWVYRVMSGPVNAASIDRNPNAY
ncbi:cytochrome d ubiquinol oxidase subunit II [Geminicoccus roseus]|uniref:cytochrome d ubiquinol oxidase subunit II n=1 Tax=Geminicoccus roseus TaxID=404900 RepID=UPI0003F8CBC8|nr:cytochrome d ubiquinol oxidase subunit II [Geminicoccus roseus]